MLVAEVRTPTIGAKYRSIEGAMRLNQPGRLLVVEPRQGPLLVRSVTEPISSCRVQFTCAVFNIRLLFGCRLGEWERLEAGCRCVARTRLQPRAQPECPHLMNARVQDPEEVIVLASKDDQLVIRQNTLVEPHKDSMLRNSWCYKKSRQSCQC